MKKMTLKTVGGGQLEISKIILGSAMLGWIWDKIGEEETFKYIDTYRRLGGDTIDTGRNYGGELDQISFGKCEGIISRYMESRGCQNELKIITKGGFPDLSMADHNIMTRFRITREALIGDFFTSYDRLHKGPIDVWMLHRDDPTKPVSYIMDVVNEIVQTGLVKVIGVSNWQLDRFLEANAYAREKGYAEFAVNEIMWSMAQIEPIARNDKTLAMMNPDMYKEYMANPIPTIAFSSQASALFTRLQNGSLTWDEVPEKVPVYDLPINKEIWEKVKEYSERTGISASTIALSYLTSNPIECAAIIGSATSAEVEDSLKDCDFTLTPEEIRYFYDLEA